MKSWPHAPPHWTHEPGLYFVTASTYSKQRHFEGEKRLDLLTGLLLDTFQESHWRVDAWAVFTNHYHLILRSSSESRPLSKVLGKVHMLSSKAVNEFDALPGRKIWHNYRDTHLTFEKSHFARLHYVIHNPVHHGLVHDAEQYPWCSAAWFARHASASFVKMVRSFPIDRLEIEDDF